MSDFSSFSPEEIERYSHHWSLDGVGISGQEALKNAKVLVVGAGGLGSPVVLYLAAAGIGTIGLVDDDSVSRSNLQRQILFDSEKIGQPKVFAAEERIRKLNPNVKINPIPIRLTARSANEFFADYDVIVDGTDRFQSHYLLNDLCIQFKKPLVYGSVYQMEGLVSVVFPGKTACYRCFYPEPPSESAVPSCNEAGVLGVAPGFIGVLQANEVLKIVLNQGSSLSGRVLHVDLLNTHIRDFKIERNPNCPSCGQTQKPKELILESDTMIFNEEIHEVSALEFQNLMQKDPNLPVLDIRELFERNACFIPGSAWIPLGELYDRASELDPSKPWIIYCAAGVRSITALEILFEKGFSKVKHLGGGIKAYRHVPGAFLQ